MTINPQSSTHTEQTVQAKPLIDDQPEDKVPNERQTKLSMLITMLRREGGATIDEMAEATAWKGNSVRGAVSGIVKKKLGIEVTSERVQGRGRVYRVI